MKRVAAMAQAKFRWACAELAALPEQQARALPVAAADPMIDPLAAIDAREKATSPPVHPNTAMIGPHRP